MTCELPELLTVLFNLLAALAFLYCARLNWQMSKQWQAMIAALGERSNPAAEPPAERLET